ncbi:MAG: hypothetical protein ACI8XO_003038 [Verrucomicrobiales bacterium]|jgi:hypothetical protein
MLMSRNIVRTTVFFAGFLLGSVCNAEELAAEKFSQFLSTYCYKCHGAEKQKADLNLEAMMQGGSPKAGDRDLWHEAAELILDGEMPPEGKPQPLPAQRDAVIADLNAWVAAFDAAVPDNPGRVTVRRLNRDEYKRTVRDLLGVEVTLADDFPPDEVSYGFDNIGDALTISPLLMEKYLDAAEAISREVIVTKSQVWPPVKRVAGDRLKRVSYEKSDENLRPDRGRLGLFREGEGQVSFNAPEDGEYEIRIRAHQDKAGSEHAHMAIKVDGKEIERVDVVAQSNRPMTRERRVKLSKGEHLIAAAYMNNFNSDGDRNLYVHWIEVQGPLGKAAPPMPEPHRRLIPEPPNPGEERSQARQMIKRFASRAWRRPVGEEEAERLGKLVDLVMDDGENFPTSMQVALQGILSSPNFLFRWELDDRPAGKDGARALDGYAMASRLSYFLWSSLPDERLFKLAEDGSLTQPAVLQSEAVRMLQDPKSEAFIKNFSGQWLQTRNLDTIEPDPEAFPEFDDELRVAMRRETELFFESVVRGDRSVIELIDADYTFVNERLAQHYGMSEVSGKNFRRVSLTPEDRRGGILGQASILTLTSNATRTSPVSRGKWVLEQLLGTPPPPPPPDVPELEETKEASATASLRERLEIHRSNPDCAGCHAKMDPIGFALENFDAIGRWRDLDGEFVIDASSELPGGVKIDGVEGLKREIASREDFLKVLTERMLTYAIGRGTEAYDRRVIESISTKLASGEPRFSLLFSEIVASDPFRLRSSEKTDD